MDSIVNSSDTGISNLPYSGLLNIAFDGSTSADRWFAESLEEFFDLNKTSNTQKDKIARQCLAGKAKNWATLVRNMNQSG